jgi:hypothetical protein
MIALPKAGEPIAPMPFPAEERRPRGPVPSSSRPSPARRARPRAAPAPSPADRPLFPEAPALFPWLERRFSPGEATLWIGPASSVGRLLELLYAGSARAGGRVSLVEGANRLNPYHVAEDGRTLEVDSSDVMERVRLARAFTAYQLVALVDGWAREVRAFRPTLLVAHDLPALFGTDEVPQEERAPLLRHLAGALRTVAERSRRPLLVTLSGEPSSFPGLTELGPRLFDVVRFRPGAGALDLEAYQEAMHLALVRRPDGQRGLEEFGPDPGQGVIRWDAPPRPTERRWRNA